MPLDRVLAAEVRSWLRKVETDLRSADADLAADPPIPEDVLFHSQQAVEKAIKAYLTLHQIPFRKTHDLRLLVKSCAACRPVDRLRLEIPLSGCRGRSRTGGSPRGTADCPGRRGRNSKAHAAGDRRA